MYIVKNKATGNDFCHSICKVLIRYHDSPSPNDTSNQKHLSSPKRNCCFLPVCGNVPELKKCT